MAVSAVPKSHVRKPIGAAVRDSVQAMMRDRRAGVMEETYWNKGGGRFAAAPNLMEGIRYDLSFRTKLGLMKQFREFYTQDEVRKAIHELYEMDKGAQAYQNLLQDVARYERACLGEIGQFVKGDLEPTLQTARRSKIMSISVDEDLLSLVSFSGLGGRPLAEWLPERQSKMAGVALDVLGLLGPDAHEVSRNLATVLTDLMDIMREDRRLAGLSSRALKIAASKQREIEDVWAFAQELSRVGHTGLKL